MGEQEVLDLKEVGMVETVEMEAVVRLEAYLAVEVEQLMVTTMVMTAQEEKYKYLSTLNKIICTQQHLPTSPPQPVEVI